MIFDLEEYLRRNTVLGSDSSALCAEILNGLFKPSEITKKNLEEVDFQSSQGNIHIKKVDKGYVMNGDYDGANVFMQDGFGEISTEMDGGLCFVTRKAENPTPVINFYDKEAVDNLREMLEKEGAYMGDGKIVEYNFAAYSFQPDKTATIDGEYFTRYANKVLKDKNILLEALNQKKM